MTNIDDQLTLVAEQEANLKFNYFDHQVAWEIGSAIREKARQQQHAIAIEIQLAGQRIFYSALAGTAPDNADWIRRKRNVVQRFYKSSHFIGLRLLQRQATLEELYGINTSDFSAHGGAFPINLLGTGFIGTITVSGAPQHQDHYLVTETLAEYLGIPSTSSNATESAIIVHKNSTTYSA